VFGTLCAPGTSGSKYFLASGMPVIDRAPVRGAVVGDRAADHLVLHRLADELEVLLGQLPGGLDGLAAAGGEEDLVQVARGVAGEPVGQLDRVRVRVGPDREERQLLGLLGGGLGELGPAVPGLDDEQPARPSRYLAAVRVPDVGALALHDGGHRVVLVRGHPGEVHPEMVVGPAVAVHGGAVCHRVPQV
jgi:hypothetical protein